MRSALLKGVSFKRALPVLRRGLSCSGSSGAGSAAASSARRQAVIVPKPTRRLLVGPPSSSLAFRAAPGEGREYGPPTSHFWGPSFYYEPWLRRPGNVTCGRYLSTSSTSAAAMNEDSAPSGTQQEPDPSSVVRRDGLALSKDDEHKEESHRRRLSEVRFFSLRRPGRRSRYYPRPTPSCVRV
jgi:hypothetical protein